MSAMIAPPAGACRHLGPWLSLPPSDDDWRRIEEGEVVARLLATPRRVLQEGVALGLVAAPAERVFRVVTDNAAFSEFMPYVEESTLETRADGVRLNFQRLKLPWGLDDLEYKVEIANERFTAGGVTVRRSAWTHVKGFGNIAESRGAWQVFECGEGALVDYRVLTDPGWSIWPWVKNLMTKRSLEPLIEAVRNRAMDAGQDADDLAEVEEDD